MRKIIIFLLLLPFSTLSNAVDFGSFSCGKIIEFGRDNNKEQMKAISMWFGGYIEGRNIEKSVNKFEFTDYQSLYALLEKECRENPTVSTEWVMWLIYNREN